MRRILLLIPLFIASCGRQETPVQPPPMVTTTQTAATSTELAGAKTIASELPDRSLFLDRSLLGSKVGSDGAVAEEKTSFAAGEPVHVTLWLKESPPDLQTSAWWFDSKGKELHRELRPMKGEKVVTFAMRDLKAGSYRVETRWGGNTAAEYEFTVK